MDAVKHKKKLKNAKNISSRAYFFARLKREAAREIVLCVSK